MTHYLPALMESVGSKFVAVCGAIVARADHSAAPECPACESWMEHVDAMPPPANLTSSYTPSKLTQGDIDAWAAGGFKIAWPKPLPNPFGSKHVRLVEADGDSRVSDVMDPLAYTIARIHGDLGDLLDLALRLRDVEQAKQIHSMVCGLSDRMQAIMELSDRKAKGL